MAEKRMFTKAIIDSDIFLDMPQSTQLLYFHLNLRADDEGFINSPKKVMRIVGSNQNDIDILLAKRYLLKFPSGVMVVKHWKLHNTIRKDRMKETVYTEEKNMLLEKDNGIYTDSATICLPVVNQVTDKVSPSIDKIRLVENRLDKTSKVKTVSKKSFHEFDLVLLSDKEYKTCVDTYGDYKTVKGIEVLHNYKLSSGKKYKSDYGALNSWVWEKIRAVKLSEQKQQEVEIVW